MIPERFMFLIPTHPRGMVHLSNHVEPDDPEPVDPDDDYPPPPYTDDPSYES